jgi:two-component system sensor histidine kinase AtoS
MSRWIGHAVKNAIWIIAGRAQLLLESVKMDKEQKDLEIILRQVRRVNYILEKFRYASMKSETHLRRTNLNKLITYVREEVMSVIATSKKVRVKENCNKQIAEVEIDPVEMKEALFNLITNALNAMPKKGGILTLETKQSNGWLIISISDNGRGISKENQKYLFKPFFSTTSDGLGLGLWIVKRIVENHNGEIQLKSRKGEGTNVVIKLPLEGGKNIGDKTTNPNP